MDTTIAKGLRLLNRIAHADAPVGVTAMAKEMGLEKSNVHRTLTTLMTLGYVQKDGATGRYGPTLKVWELGMKVVTRHPMVRAARPFMQMLHQQTQETIHLTILDGADCIYLDQIRAPVPVRITPVPGHRVPAIFPASGRVLLAFQPNVEEIVNEFRATHPRGKEIKVAATLKEFASHPPAGRDLHRKRLEPRHQQHRRRDHRPRRCCGSRHRGERASRAADARADGRLVRPGAQCVHPGGRYAAGVVAGVYLRH